MRSKVIHLVWQLVNVRILDPKHAALSVSSVEQAVVSEVVSGVVSVVSVVGEPTGFGFRHGGFCGAARCVVLGGWLLYVVL